MKVKTILLVVIVLSIGQAAFSQKTVELWSPKPPTDNGITAAETSEKGGWLVREISKATLTIYSPTKAKNTGVAVVICPGGAYICLAMQHEGSEFAQWLASRGITGIVLKYRIPNKHKEIPLDDAWQAMRYVRSHAAELGIHPDKIGIAGFSAGGHLAASTSNLYCPTGISTRPDFTLLFYPVITMEGSAAHAYSRLNLLGEHPSRTDLQRFSIEKQVNGNTPPAIIFVSDDDDGVSNMNSIAYYMALKRNGIHSALYIFPEGKHGWGMNKDFKYCDMVLELLSRWLTSFVHSAFNSKRLAYSTLFHSFVYSKSMKGDTPLGLSAMDGALAYKGGKEDALDGCR